MSEKKSKATRRSISVFRQVVIIFDTEIIPYFSSGMSCRV